MRPRSRPNFRGYVRFFLLEDLAAGDGVQFFMPFDGFRSPAVPQDAGAYDSSAEPAHGAGGAVGRFATNQPAGLASPPYWTANLSPGRVVVGWTQRA